MGSGRYSDDSWSATRAARSTKSTADIFTQSRSRRIHEMFDPSKIALRESCDSIDNPNSTPIILAMDVSGSMGMIPDYMARHGMGQLVGNILAQSPVTDPHILVGAIGDIRGDNAPLQMSQFEADNRIDEQLTMLFLEGGGGEQDSESYDLPWLFAATKTKTDSWDKRGKKGYIFTFGDEPATNRTNSKSALARVLGTAERDWTSKEMLAAAKEKWVVFHCVIEEGSRGRSKETQRTWGELLGPNALFINDYKQLPSIIPAVIAVAEGKTTMAAAIAESGEAKSALTYTFSRLQEHS